MNMNTNIHMHIYIYSIGAEGAAASLAPKAVAPAVVAALRSPME